MRAKLRTRTGSAYATVEPGGRLVHQAVTFIAGAVLACGLADPAFGWERAHSVGSNTGYADVDTAPASEASVTVPNLGTFAPGAGPVVAPDGTVYLGNEQGKLIALKADGSPAWSRDISHGYSITTSPLVAPNGWIYVIGTTKYTDHRVNPPVYVAKSQLNIFTPGGGWIGPFEFPDHNGPGVAYGPPNLWRFGGQDVVMATAQYRNRLTGGYEVRVVAFSPGGQVLGDQKVKAIVQTVSGSAGGCTFLICFPPFGFEHGVAALPTIPPGPGIFTFEGGGTPFILVSDGLKDLVGYTFDGANFIERFRVHNDGYFLLSTPTILPDGHTIIGMVKTEIQNGQEIGSGNGAILFAPPNMNPVPRIDNIGRVVAAPSVTRDGRAVLVSGDGGIYVLQGTGIVKKIDTVPFSAASAAISRTHIFVSLYNMFLTYDADSLAEVARINWVRGGESPPAIGPKGHVYAIANNTLFVFPPANKPLGGGRVLSPQGVVTIDPARTPAADPAQPETQPALQVYNPPLTTNGNRLFACLELDQDNCGKGDHKELSLAWCQKQGYAKATKFNVDSREVKAETLDGRFCSKNKCKVFDLIRCEM